MDLPSLLRIFREPSYPWSSPAPWSRWPFEAQSVRLTWVVQERNAPRGPVNTEHDLVLCLVSQVKQTLWLALGLGQALILFDTQIPYLGKANLPQQSDLRISAWAYSKYLIVNISSGPPKAKFHGALKIQKPQLFHIKIPLSQYEYSNHFRLTRSLICWCFSGWKVSVSLFS